MGTTVDITFDESVAQVRKELSDLIVSFSNHELLSFEFAKKIEQLAATTEDQVVHYVVSELWYLYDDVRDIEAQLSVEWWDFSQRLLLLLETEDDISLVSKYSIRNLIAVCAIEVLFVVFSRYGVSQALFAALVFEYIVFKGVIFVERQHFSGKKRTFPFASEKDLEVLQERHSFIPMDYPQRRDGFEGKTLFRKIYQEIGLFLMAPVLLFFRIFTADRIVVVKE